MLGLEPPPYIRAGIDLTELHPTVQSLFCAICDLLNEHSRLWMIEHKGRRAYPQVRWEDGDNELAIRMLCGNAMATVKAFEECFSAHFTVLYDSRLLTLIYTG